MSYTQYIGITFADELNGKLDLLKEECDNIRGEWNGDDNGVLEDRANNAVYLQQLIADLKETMEELL